MRKILSLVLIVFTIAVCLAAGPLLAEEEGVSLMRFLLLAWLLVFALNLVVYVRAKRESAVYIILFSVCAGLICYPVFMYLWAASLESGHFHALQRLALY